MASAAEAINKDKLYEIAEAVKVVKGNAKAKFDETIELSMNLGVDPRHADQNVRGVIDLPNGTGKTIRVGVFAKGDKADEAKAAGADVVGAEDLAALKVQISERLEADMMPVVGRLGKILGPRGMMPNPKLGSVTQDVAQAIQSAKGGQVEYRVEKAGIVHAGVGKASFSEEALLENIRTLVGAVNKARPSGAKGTYIKRISLSSTMGPGVTLDIPSALAE